jgi:hypothetical protein
MNTTCQVKPSLFLVAMMVCVSAQATTLPRAEYKASKERISATYKTDREACKSMAHNAKDVCIEQAKAKEKVALAELEFNYTGKVNDQTKLRMVKADTAYAVAKEMCDDKAGNEKSVCVKEAQAVQTKALADAKMNEKVGDAKMDAAQDKREANYKVAEQQCEALAGDAKAACVASAKAQFGMK